MTAFATWFDVGDVSYVLYYNDEIDVLSDTTIAALADPSNPQSGFVHVCTEQWNAGYRFAQVFYAVGSSQPYFLCFKPGLGNTFIIRTLVDPNDPSQGTEIVWQALSGFQNAITLATPFMANRVPYFLYHCGNVTEFTQNNTFITTLVDDTDPSKGLQSESIWAACWSPPGYAFITAFYLEDENRSFHVPYFIAHNPNDLNNLGQLELMTLVDTTEPSSGMTTVSTTVLPNGSPDVWNFATGFHARPGNEPYFLLFGQAIRQGSYTMALVGLRNQDPSQGMTALYTTIWNPGFRFAADLSVDDVPFFLMYNPLLAENETTWITTLGGPAVADGIASIYQSNALNQHGPRAVVVAFGGDPQFKAQSDDQAWVDCARAVVKAVDNLPNIRWPENVSHLQEPIGRAAAFFIQGDLTDFGGGWTMFMLHWGPKLEQFRSFFEPGYGEEAVQVPVFCGLGNHDIDADEKYLPKDFFRNHMWAYIRGRYAPNIPPREDAPQIQAVKHIDAIPAPEDKDMSNDTSWQQGQGDFSHNYSVQLAGIRFIQLHRYGGDTGWYRAGGLKWLKQELQDAEKDYTCKGVVICQHFSFGENTGPDISSEWTIASQCALLEVLANTKTMALFHGHAHQPQSRTTIQNPFDGTLYVDLAPGSIKPDDKENPLGRSIGIARFTTEWLQTEIVMTVAMGRASADGSTIDFGDPNSAVFKDTWIVAKRKWYGYVDPIVTVACDAC